jgi:cytochrome c biogenesis protein ResB
MVTMTMMMMMMMMMMIRRRRRWRRATRAGVASGRNAPMDPVSSSPLDFVYDGVGAPETATPALSTHIFDDM